MSIEDSSQSGSEEPLAAFAARKVGGLARALVEAIPAAVTESLRSFSERLADPEVQKRIVEYVETFARLVEEELDRYEADPRAVLYDEMHVGPAVLLMTDQRERGDTLLFDSLESALVSTSLAGKARASVADAPYLSADQRQRILTGLDFLEERSWRLACDLLLLGFEGALWDTAAARGVIDDQRYLTTTSRPRKVKGPNGLVREGGIEELHPSFGRFVDAEIFGAAGHDLRHGRSEGNTRAFALLSAVGILGWLDHFAGTSFMEELGEALGHCVEGFAAVEPA